MIKYIHRFLEEEEEGVRLSIATLVLVLMLIVYIASGPMLKKKGVKILRASGFTMIVGIIFTLFI